MAGFAFGELLADVVGDLVQRSGSGLGPEALQGRGEYLGGALVVPFRQRDREIALAAPVDACRPPGTGTAPVVEPAIAGFEQSGRRQTIQVESRQGPADLERL